MAGERALTIKFLGDGKDFRRMAKEAVSALDETESKGTAVARAMEALSGKIEQEMRDAASATEVLQTALGVETVAAFKEAGRSVDAIVEDLHRAGLSYDDIRADADVLADTMRRVEQAGRDMGTGIDAGAVEGEQSIKDIGPAADSAIASLRDVGSAGRTVGDDLDDGGRRAKAGLDGVHDSADNSRGVLANMVGNATQDLGALGGVAGTAGMAIGQLAEYGAEGSLTLGGLAKFAGPMIGVGVAVTGITWAMGKLKDASQRAKEEAQGMLEVQESLRDGKFSDAAIKLGEDWGGTIDSLTELGFTTEQVIGHLTGQKSIMGELGEILEKNTVKFDTGQTGLTDYGAKVNEVIGNLKGATTAFAEQGEEMRHTDERTAQIDGALRQFITTSDDTAAAIGRVDRSAEDFTDELNRAEAATRTMDDTYNRLMGSLNREDEWTNLMESLWAASDGVGDAEADTRAYIKALADMVLGLEGVPDETKTRLLAELEDGDIATVQGYLDKWKAGVDVPVRFKGQGAIGFMKDANGTPPEGSPGGLTLVGELGPELIHVPRGGQVYTASQTERMLGGAGSGGGGGNVYQITVQASPTSDLVSIGSAVIEAITAAERTQGAGWRTAVGAG